MLFFPRNLGAFVFVLQILDILIPRFTVEEVAFCQSEVDGELVWIPFCCMRNLTEEDFDTDIMSGEVRSFNFLNMGLFPKLVGDLQPFFKLGQ